MRHNNALPNSYLRKHWQNRVKTWFEQPARKKRRQLARKAKAARVFPRPADGPIRPVVQCPTFKYNAKARLGRGFTLQELATAQVSKRVARSIGISVDHRRRNRSSEALERNVARLKKYLAHLIVFPKKAGKPKKGEASSAEIAVATQHKGVIYPIKKAENVVSYVPKAQMDCGMQAYKMLQKARGDKKNLAYRIKKSQPVDDK